MAFEKNRAGIFLEGKISNEDIENIQKFKRTKAVTLTGVKSKNLEFLSELKTLNTIKLYSCQIEDYSYLKNFPKLTEIFMNTIRKPNISLDFLSDICNLEELGIGRIPNLYEFPNLSKCHKLVKLKIFVCKNLEKISNIALIPNLETFEIVDTPQEPLDLEFLMKKESLKFMYGTFSSAKDDNLFDDLLKKYNLNVE